MREPLARWLIPCVEFSFQGQRWPIIFDHRALLECEKLSGVNMLATTLANPSARFLRALLATGTGMGLLRAGTAITPHNLAYVRHLVGAGWAASMPEPEPARAPGKPGKPVEFTWLKAWASATSRDGLGLSEKRWLEMTPRQVAELERVRLARWQREELLVGILAAETVNHSMCRPDKPRSAASFMIHPLPEEEAGPLTGEYIMSQMAKLKQRR